MTASTWEHSQSYTTPLHNDVSGAGIICLIVILGILGCTEEQPAPRVRQSVGQAETDSGSQGARTRYGDKRVGVWEPDEQAMRIRFAEAVAASHVRELVDAFNKRFASSFDLRLQLQSVEGSVARVRLSDDSRLAERMGSTGSQMYVAIMTYTLTSLAPIDSVYLDVVEGSHVQPGYYTRDSWSHLVQKE